MPRQYRQVLVLAVVLAILCVVFAVLIPGFFSGENVAGIARRGAISAVISAGMTLVIITGGIDLSVGSVLALAGVAMAAVMKGYGVVPGLFAGLLVGAACGSINGLFVVFGRVPAFIATLGMLSIARGIALRTTAGRTIYGLPHGLTRVIDWNAFGVQPVPGLLAFLVLGAGHLILTQSTWGRYTLAIGGNERAARLSGVPVRSAKFAVYLAAGLCAGLAAALQVAKLGTGSPIVGEGAELESIAAVIIGGTSIMGGRGTMVGTLVGVLLISVLYTGLTQLDVSSDMQRIVIGGMVIATVLVDQLTHRARD